MITYAAVFASTVLVSIIIREFIVNPELFRHGASRWTGWLSWRYFSELEDYKEICITEGKSLKWYELLHKLWWSQLLLIIIWLFLFIIMFAIGNLK